jgi:hypothetical protein
LSSTTTFNENSFSFSISESYIVRSAVDVLLVSPKERHCHRRCRSFPTGRIRMTQRPGESKIWSSIASAGNFARLVMRLPGVLRNTIADTSSRSAATTHPDQWLENLDFLTNSVRHLIYGAGEVLDCYTISRIVFAS